VSQYSLDPNEIELQALDKTEIAAINKQNDLLQKAKNQGSKKDKEGDIAAYLSE